MSEIKIKDRAKKQVDKKYKLTAIVLVYNGEKFLEECLDCLVNQTLDDLEILLINDASTDDSLSICMKYERDYENVFIIDKEENGGLASSANLGIQLANGEYIILVDNDDLIPADAYEKLYLKAKETDADISIGQATLYHKPWIHEINDVEQRVWEKERVITDLNEFPTIFHDAFYWNKIIKKDLLIENNITLPDKMIYADRKFSHTAYIHAKTISIITDCVYIWRIRKNDESDKSLSIQRKEAWNYINRIDSYELELDKLTEAYPNYFRILMNRIIGPIYGILESEEFENAFYDKALPLLKRECAKLDNIYDNDLSIKTNIIIYLLLNDYKEAFNEFLNLKLNYEKELYDDNGKTYWKLPLFRNSEVNVPDELFEIKYMIPQFLSIDKASIENDMIIFDGIKLPTYFDFKKAEFRFIGISNFPDTIANNSYSFEIEKVGEGNYFRAEIPTADLRLFEVYDIFFRVYYNNMIYDEFRISNGQIGEIEQDSEELAIFASPNNNLTVAVQKLHENFTIKCDEESMNILVRDNNLIKHYLNTFVRNVETNEQANFKFNDDLSEMKLEWEYFLDPKSTYSLNFLGYTDVNKKKTKINMNTKHLTSFDEINLKTMDNIKVKIYQSDDGNIFIKSS